MTRRGIILSVMGIAVTVTGLALARAKMIMPPSSEAKPEPVTRPAVAPSGEFRTAVADLAAADFKTREAAQEVVGRVPAEHRDWLADALAEQKDAEVKVRLQKALDVLDDELAVNPPPLTLHLDNVDSTAVLQAMANEMQMPLRGFKSSGPYSFDLEKRPFGELWGQVCEKQISVMFRPEGDYLAVPLIYNYQVTKGFTAYFSNITTTRTADAKGNITQQTGLTVGMIADPRINVLYTSRPAIFHVIDSAGNVLLNRPTTGLAGALNENRQTMWEDGVSLPVPEKPGDRIATISGETEFVVGVGEQTRTIEDIGKFSGETFDVGNATFVVNRTAVDANHRATISLTLRDGKSPMLFDVQTFNGEGQMVFQHAYAVGMQAVVAPPAEGGPVSLKISLPVRTVKITVPFELKNVPYPH